MPQRIQVRKGTATAWTTANPVLASGEIGYETDTNKFKFGDGVTAWTSLPYVGAAADLAAHLADTTDAHDASAISFVPTGNIAATDVQTALAELDSEKSGTGHTHAAAAITYAGSTDLAATNVEAALDELDAEKKPLAVFGAKFTTDSTLTIPNATDTFLPGPTELFDNGGYHDTAINNTRMTIPAGKAGKYLLLGTCRFSANGTGSRDLAFYKNGAVVGDAYGSFAAVVGGGVTILSHASVMNLAAGDYIQLLTYQNSGSSLTCPAGYAGLSIIYLGT